MGAAQTCCHALASSCSFSLSSTTKPCAALGGALFLLCSLQFQRNLPPPGDPTWGTLPRPMLSQSPALGARSLHQDVELAPPGFVDHVCQLL